jgi:hypothetical protein
LDYYINDSKESGRAKLVGQVNEIASKLQNFKMSQKAYEALLKLNIDYDMGLTNGSASCIPEGETYWEFPTDMLGEVSVDYFDNTSNVFTTYTIDKLLRKLNFVPGNQNGIGSILLVRINGANKIDETIDLKSFISTISFQLVFYDPSINDGSIFVSHSFDIDFE